MSIKVKTNGSVGLKFGPEEKTAASKRKRKDANFLAENASGPILKTEAAPTSLKATTQTMLKNDTATALSVAQSDFVKAGDEGKLRMEQDAPQQLTPQRQFPRKGDGAVEAAPRQKLYFDQRTGRTTNRLRFHEKQKHTTRRAADGALRFANRATPGANDNSDPSKESAQFAKSTAKEAVYRAGSGAKKLHQYRVNRRNALDAIPGETEAPVKLSNPVSKRMQRKNIKKQYAAARYNRTADVPGPAAASSVARKGGASAKRTSRFVEKGKEVLYLAKKKALSIVALIAAVIMLPTLLLPSCGMLMGGGSGIVDGTSYQPDDDALLGAEAAYCEMENALRERLDSSNYEEAHDYDEYHYELDSIEHDPYVLISMLCAAHEGAWTLEEVMPTLELWFSMQYTVTETVVETPIETDPPEPSDPPSPSDPPRPPGPRPGGEVPQSNHAETQADDSASETYKTCNVKLENFNLAHLPVYTLSQSQLEVYSMYMSTLGNREDLFPDSEYVGRYGEGSYMDFAIPTEALSDEVFAAMMTEAKKYLGYPYVWGGSTPQTSFDCSGFVSWVINHTYVNGELVWGYIGRRGVTGIYSLCTPTSTPHPGDLVFFTGTYDTDGFSHIGIYVGTNPDNGHRMMLHCGDPIGYADLSSPYWVEHLYGYGKMKKP